MYSIKNFSGRLTLLICFVLLFSFCVDQKRKENLTFNVPTTWYSNELSHLNKLKGFEQELEYEKSLIALKNESNVLPFGNLDAKITLLSIGGNSSEFKSGMELFTDLTEIHLNNSTEITSEQLNSINNSDYLILSLHAINKNNITDTLTNELISKLPGTTKKILVVFGNEELIKNLHSVPFNAIILAHENHKIAQNRTAQLLFGAIGCNGKLKMQLSSFEKETGLEIKPNGRLKFTNPEEVGIDPAKLNKIDEIALNGIKSGAYPGCQIVVAMNDKIIFRKSYGSQTYDDKKNLVENNDLYDIASVTKIAASTLLAMHLNWKNKYDLSKSLGDYIPELTGKTGYGSIIIREMMAHQSGLTPFIQFYKKTLKNGQLNSEIYSTAEKEGYDLKVADGIFMKRSYVDSMYKQILATPLEEKKYKYSDLCYYFTQKIMEKQIGESQDQFLLKYIYKPMGLRFARYKPLNFFDKAQIVPTEKDMAFRKQLLHGTVHDPGAAMLGGVAGHAGLFCNATDLASIMQVFLNKGNYGGMQFFDAKTTTEFTKQQFNGNKRGAGFDRPNASGGGTCDELASQQSFGHSGFTGTLAWADPKDKVIFVFLSNRVHPDQENWKLRDMGIRTQIQHVVYEAVNSRKK
jgi:CubicO group peptidase (beta-lactamase class C family)